MIKIVPDPPPGGKLYKTVTTPFGSCDAGHGSLLAVCAGINAEDALVHASLALKGARDTAHHACMNTEANEGLLWSTFHSIELAKALVDAVVDGVEIEGDGRSAKAER
ncbi:DUF3077 domain-containing protein [Pseudomonas sp. LS1212]|uniref:DUF3077 domain-containing protein n=1 Tax=Pseudomonas sp. LS1212 TaxID=2972478 RepID=UPI00215D54BA|nr:DUF3077 domain-containing protein [Pseudomonas sp. LS1212]UVJ45565.1 DUF3077 domain-containing protein [Pseudomonas sp. LS1212]